MVTRTRETLFVEVAYDTPSVALAAWLLASAHGPRRGAHAGPAQDTRRSQVYASGRFGNGGAGAGTSRLSLSGAVPYEGGLVFELKEGSLLTPPRLRPPQLVVSVTGGARDFVLTHELRTTLRQGLRRATDHTDAWVITGGTNCGIMKVRAKPATV